MRGWWPFLHEGGSLWCLAARRNSSSFCVLSWAFPHGGARYSLDAAPEIALSRRMAMSGVMRFEFMRDRVWRMGT